MGLRVSLARLEAKSIFLSISPLLLLNLSIVQEMLLVISLIFFRLIQPSQTTSVKKYQIIEMHSSNIFI